MSSKIHKRIQRLSRTKSKMFKATTWEVENSSVLMQKVAKNLDVISTTSADNAAFNIVYGTQDYACQGYKCLCLDTLTCNSIATIASFIPGDTKVFAALSCFCRTLRNKCKEIEGVIFECNEL